MVEEYNFDDWPFETLYHRVQRKYKLIAGLDFVNGSIRRFSVLVTGESGCGKELVAQAHEASERRYKPFVAINCGAIPSDLLESQLFGHKKGAFTGAISDYQGKLQDASSGTLFLDEIGDMPMNMQVKLLRVLQERQVTPIGSSQLIDIDIRVVAATHRNLEEEISKGRFRSDLYYRLNVLPIQVSPLRERPSEIGQLLEHLRYCIVRKLTLFHFPRIYWPL